MKSIVVLGASDKAERMSNRALTLLREHQYRVIPVHPSLENIEGLTVVHELSEIIDRPDALTVYVNPEHSSEMADAILRLNPRVVIFNPGAENPALGERLRAAGIRVVEACSVVLLTTGRFASAIGEESPA